jgi:hypothetical protein
MPIRVPAERVRAYTFARQRLAQRPHLDPAHPSADVLAIVRDCGPVRTRPALSTYLSLYARAEGFSRHALDVALYQDRALVRVPCMHARLFVVPSEDLPAYYQVSRPILQEGLQGFVNGLLTDARGGNGGSMPSISELVPRILEILSARGPCTVQELAEFLPALDAPVLRDPNSTGATSSHLGQRLIPALCVQGLLVRAQTRGTWRSDLFSYVPLSAWLPGMHLVALGPDEALRRVILAYVTAFGPVSIGDIYQWLGGPRRQRVAAALMHLVDRLARVQIAGGAGEYAMLREHLDAMIAFRPQGRAVALLPPKDSYVMAYSDTSRFLDPAYRERVFDRAGEAYGTVWLDGAISGTWSVQLREERMTVRLFEPLDPEGLGLLDEETRRLGQFLEFGALDVVVGLDEAEMDDDQATIALPSIAVDR